MIYINKEKDSILLTCNCGCSMSLKFSILDSIMYVDALESNFSTVQETAVTKLQEKFDLLKHRAENKPIYRHGMILSKEEFQDFLQNLKEIVETMEEDEVEDKYVADDKKKSMLHVTQMKISEENTLYDISLRIRLSAKDLVLHPHRAYETYFTKGEMIKFINNMEKKFS